jgi:hypothetical protein
LKHYLAGERSVTSANEAPSGTPKDPLRQAITGALGKIAEHGLSPRTVDATRLPELFGPALALSGEDLPEAIVELITHMSTTIIHTRRRLAVFAALHIPPPADDLVRLGEVYEQQIGRWHAGTRRERVFESQRAWEATFGGGSADPKLPKAWAELRPSEREDAYRLVRYWWTKGRDELVELIAKDLESRVQPAPQDESSGDVATIPTDDSEPPDRTEPLRAVDQDCTLDDKDIEDFDDPDSPDARAVRLDARIGRIEDRIFRALRRIPPILIPTAYFFITLIAPAPMREPLRTIHQASRFPYGGYVSMFIFIGLIVLFLPLPPIWYRIGFVVTIGMRTALALLMFLVVLFTPLVVETETEQAFFLEHSSYDKINEQFGGDRLCPPEVNPGRARILPLTACRISDGALHARLAPYPSGETMGVYPIGDKVLKAFQDGSPLQYYIVTRFKTARYTPITSCGLSIEGDTGATDGSSRDGRALFFHVQYDNHGYTIGEAAITNLTPNSNAQSPRDAAAVERERTDFHPVGVLAKGKSLLPFLGESSWLLGPADYSEWTKLAALIEGDKVTFFIDDRAVIVAQYAGLQEIYRASAAIVAPRRVPADDVACDFDYLRVKRLPVLSVR